MKIGLEIKPFNYVMKERRLELGFTQKTLADFSGCSVDFVGLVERLRMPPGKLWLIKEKLNNIATALNVDFDELFPADYLNAIQAKKLPRRLVPIVWVRDVRIDELTARDHYLLIEDDPELEAVEMGRLDDIKQEVRSQIAALTSREQMIICMRFGIEAEHGEGMTLKEIAEKTGISIMRVRQIEQQALRKLRHPIRSRPLRLARLIT